MNLLPEYHVIPSIHKIHCNKTLEIEVGIFSKTLVDKIQDSILCVKTRGSKRSKDIS